jgi:hypothetical protein
MAAEDDEELYEAQSDDEEEAEEEDDYVRDRLPLGRCSNCYPGAVASCSGKQKAGRGRRESCKATISR